MKKILIIACFFAFTGCSVQRAYVPMTYIKHEYKLTAKQCLEIEKFAALDSIKSFYNCGTDQRLYDSSYNYAKFQKK
jgi:hypothetical protein